MSRRLLALAPVLAALTFAAPALAQSGQVTATGSAEVKVVPANRHSNSSIVAAVSAAQKKAVPAALSAAHANALVYAQSAGLTLGSLISVSDATNTNGYIGPFGGIGFGPFGLNKYCGTEFRPVFKKLGNGRLKIVRTRHIHACIVPAYATSALTVTYSAS